MNRLRHYCMLVHLVDGTEVYESYYGSESGVRQRSRMLLDSSLIRCVYVVVVKNGDCSFDFRNGVDCYAKD